MLCPWSVIVDESCECELNDREDSHTGTLFQMYVNYYVTIDKYNREQNSE